MICGPGSTRSLLAVLILQRLDDQSSHSLSYKKHKIIIHFDFYSLLLGATYTVLCPCNKIRLSTHIKIWSFWSSPPLVQAPSSFSSFRAGHKLNSLSWLQLFHQPFQHSSPPASAFAAYESNCIYRDASQALVSTSPFQPKFRHTKHSPPNSASITYVTVFWSAHPHILYIRLLRPQIHPLKHPPSPHSLQSNIKFFGIPIKSY